MEHAILDNPVVYPGNGEEVSDEMTGITFLNLTGDITVTWDPKHNEKMQELIRKKMAEGYVFFTTRKVPLTGISYKRKLGGKGLKTATDLIIRDKDFDKIVKLMDDADIASNVDNGTAGLAKRKDSTERNFQGEKRLRDANEIKKGDRLVGTKALAGG